MTQSPLHLNLNNLFAPAITDGPQGIEKFESAFAPIQRGLQALRNMGHLGFSSVPDDEEALAQTLTLARQFEGVENVVVFGIGGSALGCASLYLALRGPFAHLPRKRGEPRLFVLDNVDAATHADLFSAIDSKKTLFVVVSKSGNTSETLSQLLYAQKWISGFGPKNCVVITDPKNGFLRQWADQEKISSLSISPSVGGRFSVFTPAGLFPLAAVGVDVKAMLSGARDAERRCRDDLIAQNPAALLALSWHEWLAGKNFSQLVIMPYADRLRLFADWFVQLFAESLGKNRSLKGNPVDVGYTPIKALGTTDQHSQLQLYLEGPRDKVVTFITVQEPDVVGQLSGKKLGDERVDFLCDKSLTELMEAEKLATEESLRSANRPNATITLAAIDEYHLGQLYQTMMNVIPYLGALLDINPFDQPAVEQIKKYTFGLMGRNGFEDEARKISDKPVQVRFLF